MKNTFFKIKTHSFINELKKKSLGRYIFQFQNMLIWVSKDVSLYIFETPLTQRIHICNNICKMFKNYGCMQGNLNMCKFSLKTSVEKTVHSASFC